MLAITGQRQRVCLRSPQEAELGILLKPGTDGFHGQPEVMSLPAGLGSNRAHAAVLDNSNAVR